MSSGRRQAGFTFFELTVVVAAAGMLYLLLGQTLGSSARLSSTSRATLQASDDLRRSLDAIAAVLRGASWQSLGGFDENDVATQPTFQRALSHNINGTVLDTVETLRWRSSSRSADGIQYAGEVVLEKDGQVTVLAPRVPLGGFRVERTGTTLRVLLTTFASTSQRVVTQSSSEMLVALRN
jgi:hypothetical protein